jgi:osomolarity two-component system sensor histidine kinase SLN1
MCNCLRETILDTDTKLSKPIRRPALKQVLKKFSTIPEETETSSLTRKSTPEIATTTTTDTPSTPEQTPAAPESPVMNGTSLP